MAAQLDLELSTNCGAIDVRAASNGVPLPFASFLLLLNGTPEEPGDAITGSFDGHGYASIPRLPPGRYRIWAWKPDGDGYLGPELSAAAARGVEVSVEAGQVSSVAIEPSFSPGASR